MPRKGEVKRRDILPDPKYHDRTVTKFINMMMGGGKKSLTERIFYDALGLVAERAKEDPLGVFKRALEQVKPLVEVRSRRVGGATYQVPVEVRPQRRMSLAMRWLVQHGRARPEKSMVERYRSLGVLTIVSAGFIDGLNPCAFATLIFFVSYLTLMGRKRREVLWVGIGFAGAVFVTYLLIGFGLFRFIQHLSFLPLFSKVVYFVTILFALALGTLSLYDAVQLKKGRSSDMKLQLPEFLKKRIHRTIREKSKSPRYFGAAVVAGFIISLLEFTCTGQVYLPTILFVMSIPSLKAGAFSYLILYNIFFILPLLVIFGVVYWGVTSEQLAFFLKRRAMAIKLITALLFFALAGILIVNFF